MYRSTLFLIVALAFVVSIASAQQSSSGGPHKVLKTVKVGGEGNWDYIWADVAGRRLYIPRRAPAAPPGAEGPAPASSVRTRLTIFNLDTLEPAGEIDGIGGNGAVGRSEIRPRLHQQQADIDVRHQDDEVDQDDRRQPSHASSQTASCSTPSIERVYVFSHPTKDAMVIDAKDGTVLGNVDLGGVPEEGVPDGKGTVYVVMQDAQGGVAVVDAKTMKTTNHYPFGDKAVAAATGSRWM